MKKTTFLISSLAAAGIMPLNGKLGGGSALATSETGGSDPDQDAMVRKFAQDHSFTLAQHRSHSSHASHSSHRSGSSVRTPSYTPPAPRAPPAPAPPAPAPTRNERSNPPSSILPASPATAPQSLLSGSGETGSAPVSGSQIRLVIRKTQIGLMAYGHYDGDIDGQVGPQTRRALRAFQEKLDLEVTGTVTSEVLDAFRIAAQ